MIRFAAVVQSIPGLTEETLRAYVTAAWVRPAQRDGEPLFSEADLARLRLIQDLRDALEVEERTVPLVLSLLDQLYATRRELRAVLRMAPDDVRARIIEAWSGQK
jgi:chaperone modulatory protein CbpM